MSFFFNRGSTLGYILVAQILRGLILASLFIPSFLNFFLLLKFSLINFFFFLLRFFHANGASFFFIVVIFHIFRNLLYFSFLKKKIFIRGLVIYLILIITSFFGYVLPWGQISFWGRRVITNFLRVINIEIVFFLWGDFIPGEKILFFFFTLHFLIPFLILIIRVFHIIILTINSSSPSNLFNIKKKIPLILSFLKDYLNFIFILFIYFFFLFYIYFLGDRENFIERNKIVTPQHIKPEWYFLWAYRILRCIPSKLGGVSLLIFSILIFIKFIFLKKNNFQKKKQNFLILTLFILTFLGGQVVESPFIFLRQIFTFLYFFLILI